jgi:transposase
LYKWRKEFKEFGEGSFPRKENLKLSPSKKKYINWSKDPNKPS